MKSTKFYRYTAIDGTTFDSTVSHEAEYSCRLYEDSCERQLREKMAGHVIIANVPSEIKDKGGVFDCLAFVHIIDQEGYVLFCEWIKYTDYRELKGLDPKIIGHWTRITDVAYHVFYISDTIDNEIITLQNLIRKLDFFKDHGLERDKGMAVRDFVHYPIGDTD